MRKFLFIIVFSLFISVFFSCTRLTMETVNGLKPESGIIEFNGLEVSLLFVNQKDNEAMIPKRMNPYMYPRGLFIADLLQKPYYNLFIIDIRNKGDEDTELAFLGVDFNNTSNEIKGLYKSKSDLIQFWINQNSYEKEDIDDMISYINRSYILDKLISIKKGENRKYFFVIESKELFENINQFIVSIRIKIGEEFKVLGYTFINNQEQKIE